MYRLCLHLLGCLTLLLGDKRQPAIANHKWRSCQTTLLIGLVSGIVVKLVNELTKGTLLEAVCAMGDMPSDLVSLPLGLLSWRFGHRLVGPELVLIHIIWRVYFGALPISGGGILNGFRQTCTRSIE